MKVEIDKAIITKIEDKIICLQFKDGVDFEEDDAIETDKIFYDLCEGKPFCSLIDARVYGSISSKAREFFANDKLVKDIRIAEAFVLNNLATRMLAKFYINFNKPNNPIKIFSNVDDAKRWLSEIYEERINEFSLNNLKENKA